MADAFIHPSAICESAEIGAGSRIWAFAHVLSGARLGRDVNVCDGVFIENDVVVGDRCTLKCGVQLWDGLRLGDDVFVGPNVTFTNDPFPRSRQYPEQFPQTVLEDGVSVGGGAVILPGRRLGRHAMVGAGAVVTRDVPPFAIVVGNPARIVGYTDTEGRPLPKSGDPGSGSRHEGEGDRWITRLQKVTDLRGSLVALEWEDQLPFVPRRFFVVYDVPSRDVRGEHAHRRCAQFLVALRGTVRAISDDGRARREHVLDSPDKGLHMPAMTWGTQYAYTEDAVLAVFASDPYDPADYIRTYDEFRDLVAMT